MPVLTFQPLTSPGRKRLAMPTRLHLKPAGEHEPVGSYLFGQLGINGCSFHVEAIEVTCDEIDGDGINHATCPTFESRIEALENEYEGGFETTTIDGREYVVLVTPHCR